MLNAEIASSAAYTTCRAILCKLQNMEIHERLRAARERRYKSAAMAAEALGIPYGTYSGHENGGRGLTRDRIVDYAKKFRVSPHWLLTGEGTAQPSNVRIVGLAGAGPGGSILYSESQGELGEAPVPPGASDETVAVEVRGDSMRGIAEDGWLVYYDERHDPPTDDLLGEICVVGLADGHVLIKKLIRGRKKKHFDLESAAAPTLYDQRVEWAAPVVAIVPRRTARRARR